MSKSTLMIPANFMYAWT